MKNLRIICKILVIVGAINWGLYGLLGLDVVALILGEMSTLSKLVYVLIGACGVFEAMQLKKPAM